MGSLSKIKGRGGLEIQPWYNPFQFFKSDLMDMWNGDAVTIPAANIREEMNNYKVELAVPGLKKEDFNVDVDGSVITISCEKESETKEETDNNNSRTEYNYSSFSRSFTVPENADASHVEAKYIDGILHLSIPKKADAKKNKMQKIKVQ